mmetsp:Transcript_17906/g.46317  ORF Transcript_17906/g.46317 Transcript_17906/m.46317 type:complete len:236 (-) Transcript_17906:58-765(-)
MARQGPQASQGVSPSASRRARIIQESICPLAGSAQVLPRQTHSVQQEHLKRHGRSLPIPSPLHTAAGGDMVGVARHPALVKGQDDGGTSVLHEVQNVLGHKVFGPQPPAILQAFHIQDHEVLAGDAQLRARALHLQTACCAQAVKVACGETEYRERQPGILQLQQRGPEEHRLVVGVCHHQRHAPQRLARAAQPALAPQPRRAEERGKGQRHGDSNDRGDRDHQAKRQPTIICLG